MGGSTASVVTGRRNTQQAPPPPFALDGPQPGTADL